MKQFAAALASIFALLLVSPDRPPQASSCLDATTTSLQDVGNGPAGPEVGKDVSLPAPSASKFKRQTVKYVTEEAPGTIVIDTNRKFLYYVVGGGKAIRYGIGVGREGFGWHGIVHVGRKE